MLKSISFTPPGSKVAAYFEVGDIILFGKYKNKKGRIVGFGKDEKGQPTVEIEPVPKGQKQNKTLTLFKIRKAPVEASMRVASRYLEAEMVTRQKGTCGFCWRVQKIPNGLLANHGYNRPGYGYIEGQCLGSRHAPWEVSPVTAELARDIVKTRAAQTVQALRGLDTTDSLLFPAIGSWGKPQNILKSEVDEAKWKRLVEEKRKKLERELKDHQGALQDYEAKLASWKAQPVLEIDESKIEREKKEKQDAVRNKRFERYQGLLAKSLDRLDRTWSNLKQRETKARSKPTANNYIAIAKAANTLYQIYEGASKLADAHPERGYRAVDVLKDYDRDEIWKYMGALVGSTYKSPKELKEYSYHAYSGSLGWASNFPSLKDYNKVPNVSMDWRPNWPGWRPTKTARRVAVRFLAQFKE